MTNDLGCLYEANEFLFNFRRFEINSEVINWNACLAFGQVSEIS